MLRTAPRRGGAGVEWRAGRGETGRGGARLGGAGRPAARGVQSVLRLQIVSCPLVCRAAPSYRIAGLGLLGDASDAWRRNAAISIGD